MNDRDGRLAELGLEALRAGRFKNKISTAVYLFRRGATLIDTAAPNQWPAVREFASKKPVELVLATHHHEDHAGNLGAVGELTGARLLAPPESLDLLANGFPLQAYRRFIWGVPRRVRADPMPERIELPDGGTLEAVLLPGHSPDMTCLLDREHGLLFSADLYLSRRLRYLRADENLSQMIDSLRRSLNLDFETLLCGHRGLVEDGKERLGRKLDGLVTLRQRARDLRDKGWPIRRITRRPLGREDLMSAISLGHFSKANLIRGCF